MQSIAASAAPKQFEEVLMSTALIIGASRGIGRELVRQYRADNWRVIATARRPQDLADLVALGC